MMDEIRSLEDVLDLQREDSQIDRLLERRSGMPELDDYKGVHEQLASLDSEIGEVDARLREMALGVDKADGELKLGEVKLEREEQRLFAGGLSAKEAEHLRQEVDMLRRQNSEAETTILELMDSREIAQTEMDRLQEARQGAAAEQERLAGIIKGEWKAIDDEIARHEVKKTELVPLIDEELIELYDTLRPIKQGVAVARMTEGICGGCHLALSAAEQSQVLKNHPPRCLHCLRILVPQ
jgi:predicted  nucleic acid-binding Zn-ribbon protein